MLQGKPSTENFSLFASKEARVRWGRRGRLRQRNVAKPQRLCEQTPAVQA
jgi:hypothetical protein